MGACDRVHVGLAVVNPQVLVVLVTEQAVVGKGVLANDGDVRCELITYNCRSTIKQIIEN